MKRSRLIFVTSLVLTLLAGIVVGAVLARLPAVHGQLPAPATNAPSRGWLDDQLHLRPEQRAQIQAIWDETHQKMGKAFEKRHALEKERDDTCRALLTDEQRTKWDAVRQDYRSRIDSEAGSSRDLFHDADAKTRAVLDPEQQKMWDELKKQRDERSHRHGSGGPGGHGPMSRAATQPVPPSPDP